MCSDSNGVQVGGGSGCFKVGAGSVGVQVGAGRVV